MMKVERYSECWQGFIYLILRNNKSVKLGAAIMFSVFLKKPLHSWLRNFL